VFILITPRWCKTLLSAVSLELPLPIVKRTDLARFQPSRNAVKVEGMIAHSPSNRAFLARGRRLVRLTFNTKLHNVISENKKMNKTNKKTHPTITLKSNSTFSNPKSSTRKRTREPKVASKQQIQAGCKELLA
jgi:hypothetical protein